MLEKLKEEVYKANMDLPKYDLVTFTWGNVSGIDREKGLFVIKPSGVEYDDLTPEKMVVMDLDYLALILIAVMLRLLSIHIIVYARLKQRMKYGTA